MRILWVKAGKLLPVDTGGKIRSYNILRELARRHPVTLLTYYGGPRDLEYEGAVAEAFPGAETIHGGMPESPAGKVLDYAWRLGSAAPYAVSRFTTPAVRSTVGRWLSSNQYDVAICDFLAPTLNFPAVSPVPVVLFQHNVESMLWQRRAREERHPVKRLFYGLEAWKMTRYESRAVDRFAHVIAVSDADRLAMSDMTSPQRISVVPTGCDTSRFTPGPDPPCDGLVVFVGSMDWEPNIDGVEYFCRAVWPKVRAAVPHAVFRVVGRTPPPSIASLASGDIQITGSVPSVLEHLREAAVVVVPLRIGGGTRLKIYEAMATGRAVVSTTIGAEGLDVTHGHDILLEDEPDTLAAAIVRLLLDASERQRIEAEALRLARKYDWQNIAIEFERVLERQARGSAQTGSFGPMGAPV